MFNLSRDRVSKIFQSFGIRSRPSALPPPHISPIVSLPLSRDYEEIGTGLTAANLSHSPFMGRPLPTPTAPTPEQDPPCIKRLNLDFHTLITIRGGPDTLTLESLKQAVKVWKYHCNSTAQWISYIGVSIIQALRNGKMKSRVHPTERTIKLEVRFCRGFLASEHIHSMTRHGRHHMDISYVYSYKGSPLQVSIFTEIFPLLYPTTLQSYPNDPELAQELKDFGVSFQNQQGSLYLI